MHFLLILAILATLTIAEHSAAGPVPEGGLRLALALGGMLLAPAVAALISRSLVRLLRSGRMDRRRIVRRLRMARGLHCFVWLAAAAGILQGLDWPRLVRFNWGLEHVFLVDEILILLPVLAPLALSWAAFYGIDRELRGWDESGDAGSAGRRPQSRAQYVAIHARHYLGVLLVPVLALVAVQDAARWLLPDATEDRLVTCVYAPAVVLLAALFPVLLRHVWQTRPLEPGPLRSRLEAIAGQAGFRAREILVWDTDGLMLNAAVAGFFPWLRYVFLTDGLLSRLSNEQVQAVFGHEIGHLRHRHLLLRVAAMIVPLSLWFLADQTFPNFLGHLAGRWHVDSLEAQGVAAVFVLGGLSAYMLLVFGPYCRLLEGQADVFGCRALAGAETTRPVEIYIDALEGLAQAGAIDRNASSWQHYSIARRVAFLRRVAGDPRYEYRYHRRIWLLSGLMLAIVLSPFLSQIIRFAP